MSEKNREILTWSTISVGFIVFAIFFWQQMLIALFAFVALGTLLAIIVALPTFLITLSWEWSIWKAWQRTAKAVLICYAIVADLVSQAG